MNQLTKETLESLADENLDLAASITLTLFNQSPIMSRIRRILRKDLKMFIAELERRQLT